MEVLYILVPVAIVLTAVVTALLLWAVDRGQFENVDDEMRRVLQDDDDAPEPKQPDEQD